MPNNFLTQVHCSKFLNFRKVTLNYKNDIYEMHLGCIIKQMRL